MLRFAAKNRYDFQILKAVEDVNERQKMRLLEKMQKHFGSLKGKRIAVWGLAFKPRTDDMREAPAVPLIQGLLAAGATVQAYDPEATNIARTIFGSTCHLRRDELRRPGRRRRAGPRHRVERVPRAGLRAHAQTDEGAGRVRRPEHLQERQHEGAGLHVLLDGTAMTAGGGAGWRPQFEDVGVIVETAWRWRESRPHGYADEAAG